MATSNPRGFVPSRHQHGVVDFRQKLYATGGKNINTIMRGDPVTLDANGNLQKWPYGQATAGATPLGVAINIFDGNKRPLTHYLPSRSPSIDTSADAWVGVIDDPNVRYTVQWDTSVGRSDIAKYVTTSANSGVTALGLSGVVAAGAATASASFSHPFRIIDLSPSDEIFDGAGAGNDIEVQIVVHRGGKF